MAPGGKIHDFLRRSLSNQVSIRVFVTHDRAGIAHVEISFVESEPERLRQGTGTRLYKRWRRCARRRGRTEKRPIDFRVNCRSYGRPRRRSTSWSTAARRTAWSAAAWSTRNTATCSCINTDLLKVTVIIAIAKYRDGVCRRRTHKEIAVWRIHHQAWSTQFRIDTDGESLRNGGHDIFGPGGHTSISPIRAADRSQFVR